MRTERQPRVGGQRAGREHGIRLAEAATRDLARPDPTHRGAAYRSLIVRAAGAVRHHASWAVKVMDDGRRRSA